MVKDIASKYKKLDEVQHVLLRPGRYIGSITTVDHDDFVYNPKTKLMEKRQISFHPGFQKLFDEVISNSADFSKTPEGKHVDTIRVEVDQAKGRLSVFDNGGIPVVIHPEHKQYIPEMIFELRAGSNFDDDPDSITTGQNGEGAGLTNIFSKKFIVETCDAASPEIEKPHVFKMVFEENSQVRNKPDVKAAGKEKGFTRITWEPDWAALKMEPRIDDDNMAMLLNRCVEIAATNTHLKVYFNGERILPVPNCQFKDFIELFDTGEDWEYAYDVSKDGKFRVGISASSAGQFEHVSFVNSTRTKADAGTHVLYVGMQIWNAIRAHVLKKYKYDVPPAQLRQHLRLYLDCTIVNPRYSSQTKDELITEPKNYKAEYEPSDKFIKRILNSSMIEDIVLAAEAKKKMEEEKALRAKQKEMGKSDYRKVEKFTDANEKKERHKCILFLSEGDSASKAIQSGRGAAGQAQWIGSFPLKGKPLNVREKEVTRILGIKPKKDDDGKKAKPTVIQNVLTLLGLQIGVPVTDITQLNFGKVAFTTDADVDGAHISGLLINLFEKFWPELFDMGVINIFRTPVVKVFQGSGSKRKVICEFFTEREFREWEHKEGAKLKGWDHKYYKGLGTSSAAEFQHYFENVEEYLFRIDIVDHEDKDAIDLAFNSQRADDRKVWLTTGAANFDDFIEEVTA